MPNAFVASAADVEESMDQPTIRREYVSRTAAQDTLPSGVRCSAWEERSDGVGDPQLVRARSGDLSFDQVSADRVRRGVLPFAPPADPHDPRPAHQQLDRSVTDR